MHAAAPLKLSIVSALGFALGLAGCESATQKPPEVGASSAASPVEAPGEDSAHAGGVQPSSNGAVMAWEGDIAWIGGTTGMPARLARRFSLSSKTWSELPPLHEGRLHLTAGMMGDAAVVVGGMRGVGKHSDLLERFSASEGTWKTFGRLPKALSGPASASVGERLYVFGGDEVLNASLRDYDAQSVGDAYVLSAEANPKAIAPMPRAREQASAVAVDGKIYVIGGRVALGGQDSMPRSTDAVDVYDTASDGWSEGPSLPRRADGHAVLHGKQIVFFGDGALNPTEPMRLDLETQAWTKGARPDKELVGSTVEGAVSIDGHLYVLALVLHGFTEPKEPRVLEYQPREDRWTRVDAN